MTIQPIAYSYWRLIKAERKSFNSLSDESKNGKPAMKDQVLSIAKEEVKNGVITEAEFKKYTGLEYTDETVVE